jgi:hypothetical protein
MRDNGGNTTFFHFDSCGRREAQKRREAEVDAMSSDMKLSVLKIIFGWLLVCNLFVVLCYIGAGRSMGQVSSLVIVLGIIDFIVMVWFLPDHWD